MRQSRIFKKMVITLFSTFFTLIVFTVKTEKDDFGLLYNQVAANFVANSLFIFVKVD